MMPSNNGEIEQELIDLPEMVADSLLKWRTKTLEREKTDALLYLRFKAGEPGRTATEIKALINSSEGHFSANLEEAKAESRYTFLNEKLMAAKKVASLRTAF